MQIDLKEYKKQPSKKEKGFSFEFKKWRPLNSKVSDKLKSRFYRELKVLLKSGITIEEALDILLKQTSNKKLKHIISSVYNELIKGRTLVYSITSTSSFSFFEINTIAIGEETNNLPVVLDQLEVFYERKYKLRSQILTVLTYPAFVILITFAVLVFMLRNVVPMFEKVFKQFNSDLPNLTKKIIYISENFSIFLLIVVTSILCSILLHLRFRKSNNYRSFISKVILKTPFIGKMVRAIYLSRFCRALNLLLTSKVSLVDSLEFIKPMIGFYPIENSIESIKQSVIKGKSLSVSLEEHEIYDLNLVSMVKVSERVNELDDMFGYLTEQYSNEVDTKSKRIGSLIEPIIIIVIGSLVGVIMVSMYLPMFDLSKILNSN